MFIGLGRHFKKNIMALKHIRVCAGFCVVVFIFLVVNSSRADMEDISPDIAKLQENISGVKSLIQNVIKNYNKLEKLAVSDSVESDYNTNSEKKQFNMDKRNKGRIKFTTDFQILNGKSHIFSGESEREGASEIDEKKIIDISKENDNIRNFETDSEEFIKRKPISPSKLVTDTQIKLRNVKYDNESNEDDSSADNVKDSHHKQNSNREPYTKKKVLVIHMAKEKPNQHKNRATTASQKHISSNKPKRQITKQIRSEEVVQDSYSEDDRAMESEVKKASYLRQAYADACHLVIIRKCLRALRAALNDVCSKSRKCSSKYKDDFREYGHEGCNQQFDGQKSACRMGLDIAVDTREDSEKQENAGHSGIGKQERKATRKEKKTPEHADNHEVNILRDRFEKLCKKTSYTKCRAACKYASNKSCDKHECVSAKKKALKKSCKRRCQETYAYRGGSDESSDYDENESD
ncbi:uncharacterized protein LOC133531148 isoform X2 [Cydia pomonella]|uniref:uncharacterized protein LOC133531148 isoform X2 n=1 Tax=Cydia pomonella TaxID=82600 RepID=UPI002ADE8B27|nr:uncharacterized protein LOC133531148 isoform X2 [Cydia pomonella]